MHPQVRSRFCILWELDLDIMATYLIPMIVNGDEEESTDLWRIRRLWRLIDNFTLASPSLFTQVLLPALSRCSTSLIMSIKLSNYVLLNKVVLTNHLEQLMSALHSTSETALQVDLRQCMYCKLPYGFADTPSRLKLCEQRHDCWLFYEKMAQALVSDATRGIHIRSISIEDVDVNTGMGMHIMGWVLNLRQRVDWPGPKELILDEFTMNAANDAMLPLLQRVLHCFPYQRISVGKIYTLNNWKQCVPDKILDMLTGCPALKNLDFCDINWHECKKDGRGLRCLARIPGLKSLTIRRTHPEQDKTVDSTCTFLSLLSSAHAAALPGEALHNLETVTLTFQNTNSKVPVDTQAFGHDYMPKLRRLHIWCDVGSPEAAIRMLYFLKGLVRVRENTDKGAMLDSISIVSSYISKDLAENRAPDGLQQRLRRICRSLDLPKRIPGERSLMVTTQ